MTNDALSRAVGILTEYAKGLSSGEGLRQDVFLLVSSLTPIPNIDMFIQNDKGHILLSRRNDTFFGRGWHIPGGCIRFGERMEDRIRKNSIEELGFEVQFDPLPIAIRDVLPPLNSHLENPRIRCHNLTVLFRCWLPKCYVINNKNLTENDQGYLKWFADIPADFLTIQHVYDDVLYENGYLRGAQNSETMAR